MKEVEQCLGLQLAGMSAAAACVNCCLVEEWVQVGRRVLVLQGLFLNKSTSVKNRARDGAAFVTVMWCRTFCLTAH
jgi:hypothetical protein